MKVHWWKDGLLVGMTAFCLACVGVIVSGLLALARDAQPTHTDRPLTHAEASAIDAAIGLMRRQRLLNEATLATEIERKGQWRAAREGDRYLVQAEKNGDTPYAYTLANGHHPTAVVLAPRFFTDTTPTGRAALLLHEMGHYRAYVRTGRSDEFDGYKAEYDANEKLRLSKDDGLVYFSMLDGVAEYVAPRLPAYKKFPDVKGYIDQSNDR